MGTVRSNVAVLLTFIFLSIGTTTQLFALTKAEAQVCVNQGINALLSGKPISGMIDAAYMIAREKIPTSEARVAQLVNQRALENKGYYRNVTANVVGQPQAKKGDYFLVAGHVTGLETKKLDPVEWKPFNYNYILWIRKDADRCLIGVLDVEGVFRLALWVKENL